MRTTRSLPYGDRDPPDRDPPVWTESQTGVKTLPCRNFVAGGKKKLKEGLNMNPLVIDYESEDLVGGWTERDPNWRIKSFQSTGRKLSELHYCY